MSVSGAARELRGIEFPAAAFQVSCLEGVGAAALGAPIVGYLCENVFGYVRPPHDGLLAAAPAESVRVGNARAISLAMLCMTVGPWLLTIVAYGVLHLTYKSDSRHGSAFAGACACAAVRRSL